MSSPVQPAYLISLRLGGAALVRGRDGLDRAATVAAFARALEPVLREQIGELARAEATLTLTTEPDLGPHVVEVEGPDLATARRIEREVRDLIWVVREMVPFAVLG